MRRRARWIVAATIMALAITKNAILLVDFAIRAGVTASDGTVVEAGLPRNEARVRLHPILMTTLAMIFGMVPLALALTNGHSAGLRRPRVRTARPRRCRPGAPVKIMQPAALPPIFTVRQQQPERTLFSLFPPSPFSPHRLHHRPAMNYEQARFNMIEQQIRPWEVLDHQVLSLLAIVRREDFVPAEHRALAFVDMEIPLPPQHNPSQCMLSPKVEARILQDLSVQKHEKVLEIGTGSGYMAALLAHRAQQVVTMEIEPSLAETARANLQRAGVHNAEVRTGDGAANLASADDALRGPFDVIVLSGSVAEVPKSLLALLKVGGRLSAIVGFQPVMRATLVTRVGEDAWRTTQAWDTVAPRLSHFAEPSKFSF